VLGVDDNVTLLKIHPAIVRVWGRKASISARLTVLAPPAFT
jgi:hypothetical protein